MPAEVFFIPLPDGVAVETQVAALRRLYEHCQVNQLLEERSFVAIKMSVGEKHNDTHIKPPLAAEVVRQVKQRRAYPFLTETSTLYKGERENAVKHLVHANNHGFGLEQVGAPFIMADGLLGDSEIEVPIKGELFQQVNIAREAVIADAVIGLAHPTGHVATGIGACIKNLGMGLASRMGKMRQHSALKPQVVASKCRFCGKCLTWCPAGVISEKDGKAFINDERCIGCGECLTVCRFDSIRYDWDADPSHLQKAMAEHALGSVLNKLDHCFFFNVLVDMTKDCDCMGEKQHKLIPDVGILASRDPVAIDVATLDLTAQANGENLGIASYPEHDPMIQLRHAAKIGLGQLEYQLITVDFQ